MYYREAFGSATMYKDPEPAEWTPPESDPLDYFPIGEFAREYSNPAYVDGNVLAPKYLGESVRPQFMNCLGKRRHNPPGRKRIGESG